MFETAIPNLRGSDVFKSMVLGTLKLDTLFKTPQGIFCYVEYQNFNCSLYKEESCA